MIDEDPLVGLVARGMPVVLSKHAFHAMGNERPPIRVERVLRVLDEPDSDGPVGGARKRWGGRTIIVRYVVSEGTLYVRTVSQTKARRA